MSYLECLISTCEEGIIRSKRDQNPMLSVGGIIKSLVYACRLIYSAQFPTQLSSSGGKVLHSHSKNKAVRTLLKPFPQQIPHSQHSHPTSNVACKSSCVAMITRTEIHNPRPLCLNLNCHSQNWRYGRRRRWHHLTVKELGGFPGGADRCGRLHIRHFGRRHPCWSQRDEHSFRSHLSRINKCASTEHRSSPDQNKSKHRKRNQS